MARSPVPAEGSSTTSAGGVAAGRPGGETRPTWGGERLGGRASFVPPRGGGGGAESRRRQGGRGSEQIQGEDPGERTRASRSGALSTSTGSNPSRPRSHSRAGAGSPRSGSVSGGS